MTTDSIFSVSLTPGFSRVLNAAPRDNRFSGFSPRVETVKTVSISGRPAFTGLKPGVNEATS